LVNEVAVIDGAAGADDEDADAGADEAADAGALALLDAPAFPDELLPHAAATTPTPAIATRYARLWVKGKISSR
jgi:hypothetical protein